MQLRDVVVVPIGKIIAINAYIKKKRDVPGGAVVKSPSANSGDTGLSPGPGRSHMPWSS